MKINRFRTKHYILILAHLRSSLKEASIPPENSLEITSFVLYCVLVAFQNPDPKRRP